MDKQFECYVLIGSEDIHGAVDVGFAISIGAGSVSRAEIVARFEALEVGETLIDEDGDTWERIA